MGLLPTQHIPPLGKIMAQLQHHRHNPKGTIMNTHTCPRCGEGIPNNLQRGMYPGALSRTDNKTEICSPCGTDEAMEDFFTTLTPKNQWKNRTQTPAI